MSENSSNIQTSKFPDWQTCIFTYLVAKTHLIQLFCGFGFRRNERNCLYLFINHLLILVYLISSVLLDVVFFSFYLTPCNVQKIPILILIHTSIFKLSFIKKIVSVSYLKYSKSILLVSIYMYFYLNTQPSKNIYLINFGKNGYFVLLKKFYIIFFIVNLESFYF